MTFAQDPDALYDDRPIARIEICCRRNGSMSVSGSIEDLSYALAMLENAKDSVRAYHGRRQASKAASIIIPRSDVGM